MDWIIVFFVGYAMGRWDGHRRGVEDGMLREQRSRELYAKDLERDGHALEA